MFSHRETQGLAWTPETGAAEVIPRPAIAGDRATRRRLRRPDTNGPTPVVALTAYARSEDRTRAMQAGFANHVAKPVEPAELIAVIASIARHLRGRQTPT